jgi:subtilisin family serine protease
MCAFDAGIAAPAATLLDYAVLLSPSAGSAAMSGFLSDAVLAYGRLLRLLSLGSLTSLVVTNSWGMYSLAGDFPQGHPGNYSDNPAHPFNVIVASLERAGADICFAAGNCGLDCPDGRCAFAGSRPICGANSHEAVLTVAGIDVNLNRVGYSSQGPGRLEPDKPDISGYTYFSGSGASPVDDGTSAACPVVAGLVAAVRTVCPPGRLPPAQLRALVAKTAIDLSGTCFNFDYGWGYPNAGALASAVEKVASGAPPPVL